MHALLQDVATRASAYLDGLTERKVAPIRQQLRRSVRSMATTARNPVRPAHEVVALLDRYGSPATMAILTAIFGFVIGSALPAALAMTDKLPEPGLAAITTSPQ